MSADVADETTVPPADPDENEDQIDEQEAPPGLSPDVDLPTDDEPEPAPEPAVGRSQEQIEASFKKVEQAYKRYTATIERELSDVLPETAACPLCDPSIPGYVVLTSIGDEQRYATLELLGKPREDQFVEDKTTRECPDCGGWGETLTGAKNPAHRTRVCPKCVGNGWINESELHTNIIQFQPTGGNDALTPPAPVEKPWGSEYGVSPDLMGRPPGHVDYWVAPGAPTRATA